MAGKEKKSAVVRHLSKESSAEKEKSISPGDTPKRRSGRQAVDTKTKPSSSENVKRPGRPRKKLDLPTPPVEEQKVTTPKSGRKSFLEKELEDILENATGRNTPSIGPREADDVTTFLRARRLPEIEDDVLSLRSVKVRKDDDDNVSVRSLPARKKPGPKPKKLQLPVVKGRPPKVKKEPAATSKAASTKKKLIKKDKDAKKVVKKPLKVAQNRPKLGAKRRSNLLIKKKLKNAQKAVKRIYRRKNVLKNLTQLTESTVSLGETNGEMIVQEETETVASLPVVRKRMATKEAGVKKRIVKKKATVADETAVPPAAELEKKNVGNAVTAVEKKKPGRKRKSESGIVYETKQSPHDSSLLIVQPRLGPKVRKTAKGNVEALGANGNLPSAPVVTVASAPSVISTISLTSAVNSASATAVATTVNATGPTSVASTVNSAGAACVASVVVPAGPTSPAGTSTPYFIQAVSNFSSLKSQTNVQGDWLVTPTGVVLIQAVPQVERTSRVENPETMSTSLTPAVPLPVSGSAPAQSDSMLSEKAKEAEPALAVALPVIPVAKNVSELLLIKSQMGEAAGATPGSSPSDELVDHNTTESLDFGTRTVTSERRASHDGSFGPSPPSRLIRRTGSCDRLGARSPRSILELGSEPLFLEEAVKMVETDSSFSLPLPRRVRSGELRKSPHHSPRPEVVEDVTVAASTVDPLVVNSLKPDDSVEPMAVEVAEPVEIVAVDEKSGEMLEAEGTASPMGPSQHVEKIEVEKPELVNDCQSLTEPPLVVEIMPAVEPVENHPLLESDLLEDLSSLVETSVVNEKPLLVEPSPDVIMQIRTPSPAAATIEVPLTMPQPKELLAGELAVPKQQTIAPVEAPAKRCPKDESRNSNRAKKYSRSLDSRQKLLPVLRRRSHPEPRVINIVTCEDGTRQGRTLVDELRLSHQCVKVPYHASSSSFPPDPPKSLPEDTPQDRVSKETILSALGLRSLEEAAELEKLKKKQQLLKQQQILLQQQQQQRQQQQQQREREQQLAAVNNNYTGTLKTVIKIQRPEKKGNGRMIYKASSAGAGSEIPPIEEEATTDSGGTKESHESGDDETKSGNGKAKALVIPEKASSFSIHPQRLCSDVCTYCFGKFGLLDTPCHIAQLKDGEKRRNILAAETHLTLDSCLCDACFRHVDKKSNCPTFTEKKTINKRKLMPRKQSICCVVGCDLEGKHNIRRKSLYKLKKSLAKKLSLDQEKIDKVIPAHLVSLCNRHIYWVDYFMSCGICNKRLNNVHNMYRVGTDVLDLNAVLSADGIPAVLTDKRFLCKMCHCYTSIRAKVKDPSEMSTNQRNFYDSCRRRILQEHGIEVPDSEVEGEMEEISPKNGKPAKTGKKLKPSATVTNGLSDDTDVLPKVDSGPKPGTSGEELSDLRAKFKPLPPPAEGGFHKCSSTLQFTKETKNLFYELQRPYGNHSSFFRHLILLEKYFRSGDLVLSRRADQQAVKYVNGVNNRLRSYEGTPKTSSRPFTLTAVPAASSTPIPSISGRPPTPVNSPLSQMQATVQSIGLKPEISITSVPQEPRKLTPKIQENLRALANRVSSGKSTSSQTRAVILNRTVGGQKQSLVQVTTGGKTIHLTLAQFRRIQQMQLRKKQFLEQQKKGKGSRTNGPSEEPFPNIPKALSVSVTKVPSVDLTKSPTRPE